MYLSKYNLIFDTDEQNQHIILNPLSGAMDFFDSRAVELLNTYKNPALLEAFPEFFRYCVERGYAYQSISDEQTKLCEFEEKSSELYSREPLRVEIYVTFLCNLRCTYCFESSHLHNKKGVVQPDVIDSMFRTISDLNKLLNNQLPPFIKLFGGEPLLKGRTHLEAIKRILDLCKEKDYRVAIITNGVHLGYYANMLSEYNIDYIQVTLDGPQKVHDQRRVFANGKGSFKYIVESIDRAIEKGLKIMIRVNVDEENIAFLPDLADFIIKKGWLEKGVTVGISPVNQFGSEHECCLEQVGMNTLEKLLEMKIQYKQTSFMSICCRLVEYFDHILEYGSLPFPKIKYCLATKGIGNQVSLDLFGNIFGCCCMNCCETENSNLGRFHPALELNENVLASWTNRSILTLPQCKECSLALVCGGGCTRLVLRHGKNLKSDVVCPPMVNMNSLQLLVNYYMPLILKKSIL